MPESLYLLAVLACPVGMGVMMWMMNRRPQAPAVGTADKQAELARLQTEIDRLRGERPEVGDSTERARPAR